MCLSRSNMKDVLNVFVIHSKTGAGSKNPAVESASTPHTPEPSTPGPCRTLWNVLRSASSESIPAPYKPYFGTCSKLTDLTVLWQYMVQMVENLPAMQETQVQSLEWEDPLEKEMATHSSPLAWRIPWTEEPGGLQSMGSQKSQTWLSNDQIPTTRQVFEHAFDLEAFFLICKE